MVDTSVIVSPAPSVPPRPGDVILIRAIKFWDSGQIQRVCWGLGITVLPILYDLWNHNALTWRTLVSAIIFAILTRIGYKRAASPDVVTGIKSLDKANVEATLVPPVGPKTGI